MEISFLGAARAVTGSMHLLTIKGRRILLDCGLVQGKRKEAFRRNRNLPLAPRDIDAVLLSHAHIDHSGNLPTLVRNGFRGTIYATSATRDLCAVMLPDSGRIQERDVAWVNKKRKRQGKNLFEPLYTGKDGEATIEYFRNVSYEKPFRLDDSLEVVYHDAGHILGSAMIELRIKEMGRVHHLIFTGDIGRADQPILRDPWQPEKTDVLIMESTYGGRGHEGEERIRGKLLPVLQAAVAQKGKVIIPSFSVGRTQHLVYLLHRLAQEGVLPPVPIFVDSPLSVNATRVFREHPECYDREIMDFLRREKDPFGFSRLNYIKDVQDSKTLNTRPGPVVIISSSGMCEGGRILHHLKNAVEDQRNTILIIGYMAENTLGRRILEREKQLKIFGDEYTLNAKVEVINAFSAHADQQELLGFVEGTKGNVRKIFLVHGEESQALTFALKLGERGFHNVEVPSLGQTFEL